MPSKGAKRYLEFKRTMGVIHDTQRRLNEGTYEERIERLRKMNEVVGRYMTARAWTNFPKRELTPDDLVGLPFREA